MTSENTLFQTETIDFEAIKQPVLEEESDGEEERQRDEELKNALENAFDDITDDESSRENSSLYSESQIDSQRVVSEVGNGNCNSVNSLQNVYSEGKEASQEYLYTRDIPFNNQQIGSVWSDQSDHSGNFNHQDSVISSSPTHFLLNMKDVVSHSEESEMEVVNLKKINKEKNEVINPLHLRNEIDQSAYLSAETSFSQLKLLYDARGREIDKLSEELEELKKSSFEKVSRLNNQIITMKMEKDRLEISKNQMNILLAESEGRIRSLSEDLKEKDKKFNNLENENRELKQKINVAEGTISSLQCQVSELQFAKSRQAHEDFLQKLKNSYDEQKEELNRKFQSASSRADNYKQEISMLQEELTTMRKSKEICLKEKSEVIHELKSNLEEAKHKIKMLSISKNNSTLGNEASMNNNELKEKFHVMEKELIEAKDCLKSYDMLLKMGFFQSVASSENSINQLNLKKALSFEESNAVPAVPSYSSNNVDNNANSTDINEKLKKELQQIFFRNKLLRDEIGKLQENLSIKDRNLRVVESKLKSLQENYKCPQNSSSNDLSQMYSILEENTILKKDVICLIQNITSIRNKNVEMVAKLTDIIDKNDTFFSNSPKGLITQIQSLQTVINNFYETMEKFGKFYYTFWDDLKQENMQLISKRYTILSSFGTLLNILSNLKDDLQFKKYPDSSHALTLKQLLENFSLNTKQLKDETKEYFHHSTKLQNDLWSLKLDLERTQNENKNLKDKIKMLDENTKKIEEENNQTIVKCKEQYLKSHETALSEIKSKLKIEYDSLITSYKEKLTELQNNYEKLESEKKKLEDKDKVYLSLGGESVREENNALKIILKKLTEKYTEMENEYKTKLKEVEFQFESQKSCEGLSISDSVKLFEIKEKNKQLLKKIEILKVEADKMKVNHDEEKKLIGTELRNLQTRLEERGSYDCGSDKAEIENCFGINISFSNLQDTIERFKKSNNELKNEKEKLKSYYETEIRELQSKMNNIHNNNNSASSKENEQLKSLINEVMSKLNCLKKEKETLESKFSHQIQNLTEQMQNKEQYIMDLKQNMEMKENDFSKHMNENNMEKKEVIDKLAFLCNRHGRLKQKIDKYKEIYQKYNNLKEQLEIHKNILIYRLQDMRDKLTQVIENLNNVQEKSVPQLSLKHHINALGIISNYLLEAVKYIEEKT